MSERERTAMTGGAGMPGGAISGERAGAFASRSWHGTAFLVEALVLLLFLVASLGIFMQAFARARATGSQAAQLERAVALASDMAERFCADPAAVSAPVEEGGLVAACDVEAPADGEATPLRATITVTDADGDVVFELTTARATGDAGAAGTAGTPSPADVPSPTARDGEAG